MAADEPFLTLSSLEIDSNADNAQKQTGQTQSVSIDIARNIASKYLTKDKFISIYLLLMDVPSSENADLSAKKALKCIEAVKQPHFSIGDQFIDLVHGFKANNRVPKVLCALHLVGCHKIIKNLFNTPVWNRGRIRKCFEGRETDILSPFTVNLYKFCESLTENDARTFFGQFDDSQSDCFEVSILKLITKDVLLPNQPLDGKTDGHFEP